MQNIALHIFDIVRNPVEAKATEITIELFIDDDNDKIVFCINDNGIGMDEETLDSLMNPLYLEYSNKLGLGLSFLKQNTELCDGNLLLFSEKNIGTRVIATFKKSHPNRPPIGDIAGVISLLMCGNPEINFIYLQRKNNKNFEICTNKIKAIMKNIPINHPKIRQFVKDSILESIIEFNIE